MIYYLPVGKRWRKVTRAEVHFSNFRPLFNIVCYTAKGSLISNNDDEGYENVIFSEFALLQTLSCVFHLVQFVKCLRIFLELNSKGLHKSSEKEKESRCLAFMSAKNVKLGSFTS